MFAFWETRGRIDVAFTDRHRGTGGGPSASLDLAEPADDAPQRESRLAGLAENLDVVGHALVRGGEAPGDNPFDLPRGARVPTLVRMRQVHGADVHVVERSSLDLPAEEPPVADGLVTALPGVALVVRAADCVPVILADLDRGVVGAAHAGRPGLVAGVVPATVARMRGIGAERIVAWLGPRVCGRCYEVPAAMRDEVAAAVPESFAETSWGTPAVDVAAGVAAQLAALDAEVVDVARCTREDDRLFSYRREGQAAGRLGGVVWVRP